jgi:ectoine hydroxylase-related dioxygenase (phytanoyl-CoA dioxygenase family)
VAEISDLDDGYGVHPGVLQAAQVAALAATVEQPGDGHAGIRHLLRLAGVALLASDLRLINLAAQYIGEWPAPLTATLFNKTSDTNWLVAWHQDTALPVQVRHDDKAWGPWSIKAGQLYGRAPASVLSRVIALRVHFDDSAADNGPLRVLPGTHRLGRLSEEQVSEASERIAAVPLLVAAGGVIALRPLTIHASSKSTSSRSRRVLHIEYAPRDVIEQYDLAVG